MTAQFHVKRKGFLQTFVRLLIGGALVVGLVLLIKWLTHGLAALLLTSTVFLVFTLWVVR